MILFPSAMSSSVNHSLAATGDSLRLTTAPCSATYRLPVLLRSRPPISIWASYPKGHCGSFWGRRGPNDARPKIPLLPAALIRTSTRRWKSRKSPRSVYRWFRPVPRPVKTPFSTRQSPGWLGCVFQPVRSRPLKRGTNSGVDGASAIVAALPDSGTVAQTIRKPTLANRSVGLRESREDDVADIPQSNAPPRETRYSPCVGPVGSVAGEPEYGPNQS